MFECKIIAWLLASHRKKCLSFQIFQTLFVKTHLNRTEIVKKTRDFVLINRVNFILIDPNNEERIYISFFLPTSHISQQSTKANNKKKKIERNSNKNKAPPKYSLSSI
jgi:hypothetical protein